MADKIPVKAKYTGSDTTALAEFESGDTLANSYLNTGTSANQLVQLDGSAKLPAVDGSLLTNLPSGGATTINGLTDVDTSTAAPTDGQVLTWDNAASKWEPATAGGGGGGGGAWSRISTTTVSSAVAQIEWTLTGYSVYTILYYGANWGSNDNSFAIDITVGSGGSYSETVKFLMHRFGGNYSANQNSVYGDTGTMLEMWPGTRVDSSNGSNFGEITIFNTAGMPTCQIRDNLMDDTNLSVGIVTAILGFSSPSSSDTIGKIKVKGSQGNNFEAGTFVLYGVATS